MHILYAEANVIFTFCLCCTLIRESERKYTFVITSHSEVEEPVAGHVAIVHLENFQQAPETNGKGKTCFESVAHNSS